MELEVLTVFAICAAVYVLSRVVGWIVEEKEIKVAREKEEARLERVASLYGRNNKEW